MPKKINKQLTPGRPRNAVNKAELPTNITKPKTPKVSLGELPKQIVGSHMGSMAITPLAPPKAQGPSLTKGPTKFPSRPRKGPPLL